MTKSVARLYNSFHPEQYGLALNINKQAMTFSGRVMIRGKKVGKPSQRLTFHQNGLKITGASVIKHDKKGDQQYEIGRINNQDTLDEVRLHSEVMFYPGEYSIIMDFTGEITRPMHGLYPCFFEHNGTAKKFIASQFESHHAREAFPCIDEPEAKATFDLTLITPVGETVIANTPEVESRVEDDLQVTTFETTPRMSSYLLAFVVGEMGYTEATTKNGISVRSYATPDKIDQTQYSADFGVKVLEFFEDYFGAAYPLPKLDMIALPDFSVGAMENWGLMTFREQCMLVDEVSSSIETRQTVALVVAHEISHQWFGNLVTMKWWDDLWLNESFANMMEYRAVDAIYPEWDIWEQFVSHEGIGAKRRDSLVDIQSVHTDVNHPDQINTIFDPSIVYSKGGTLLYMLMHYLGEDVFQKGLASYFAKHAFGNTVADDLWEALSEVSGQDVGDFMANWLSKPGYPIVDVAWKPGDSEMQLTQTRFLGDPSVHDEQHTIWQVPLASTSEVEPRLLTKAKQSIAVTGDSVILNHDGQSYFLPRYSNAEHVRLIVAAIKNGTVSTIDRLLLLDNYNLLQRGDFASTVELLNLVKGYTHETNENVWGGLAMSLAEGRKLIEGNDTAEANMNKLIQDLVAPLLPELGWDDQPDDSAQTLRLRGLIYSLAAGSKTQEVLDEALTRFKAMKKPSDLPASTRGVVYFVAARYGSDDDFAKLVELHETLQSADEKEEVASGLTSIKDSARSMQLLAMFTTESIRRQDLMHWFAWLLRNRYSRDATWQWMKDNWSWIDTEFGSDKSFDYFARFPGSVFSRQSELDDYQAFFADKREIIALSRNITLAEQEITSRISWRERNEQAVNDYFA